MVLAVLLVAMGFSHLLYPCSADERAALREFPQYGGKGVTDEYLSGSWPDPPLMRWIRWFVAPHPQGGWGCYIAYYESAGTRSILQTAAREARLGGGAAALRAGWRRDLLPGVLRVPRWLQILGVRRFCWWTEVEGTPACRSYQGRIAKTGLALTGCVAKATRATDHTPQPSCCCSGVQHATTQSSAPSSGP